jgi:hypothetical protein
LRIGHRQHCHQTCPIVAQGSRSGGAQPIDGTRLSELRAAKPLDEVAASDPTALLQLAKDGIDGPEAADDPGFGGDAVARHDAVALEEPHGHGVSAFGRCRRPSPQGQRTGSSIGDERPAAGGLWWAAPRDPSTAALPAVRASRPAKRPEGRERVVGHQAAQNQVPERIERIPLGRDRTADIPCRHGGCAEQVAIEARATTRELREQDVAQPWVSRLRVGHRASTAASGVSKARRSGR